MAPTNSQIYIYASGNQDHKYLFNVCTGTKPKHVIIDYYDLKQGVSYKHLS